MCLVRFLGLCRWKGCPLSDTLAERLEDITEKAKERLLALDDAIRQAVGDAPFAGHKMTPDQQMERWLMGRNDPLFWQGMIAQSLEHHNLPIGSGIPKDVLDQDIEMQRRWEERQSNGDR